MSQPEDQTFLIAAAPDLLAACEPLALLWHESMEHRAGGDDAPIYGFANKHITVGDIKRARAAIAKAKGQS